MQEQSIIINKKRALIVGGIITAVYSVIMSSILSYAFYKFLPAGSNFDRLEIINIIFPLFLIILGSFLLLFIVMCDAYEHNLKKEKNNK